MSIANLPLEDLDKQSAIDARLLRLLVSSCASLTKLIEERSSLWERPEQEALSFEERRLTLQFFDRLMDYQLLLDQLSNFHLDFWGIDVFSDPRRHARHFALGFYAYCSQLALGLCFIERTLNKPQFEVFLDEGFEEMGLTRGSYSRLKWNVVHVENLGKVFTAHQYHKLMALTHYPKLSEDSELGFILEDVERVYQETKLRLKSEGVRLFTGNAFDIFKDGFYRAWFPVQTEIARFFGHTKVKRVGGAMISREQALEAAALSLPGDIIVERRNWYLSNIGLPGFWPHAALWLGTPEELRARFDHDAETTAFFGMAFSEHLRAKYPAAWQSYTSLDEEGQPHRLLEALGEGVVFTSAERSLHADYAAAMRPRLSTVGIAIALDRAFSYAGRAYDFDFDLHSDRSIFCSELVFKAYEPGPIERDGERLLFRGVRLTTVQLLGRATLPPNEIVAQFDRELDTPDEQLSFAWFLDGREADSSASFQDQESFRSSYKRPKWDISQE